MDRKPALLTDQDPAAIPILFCLVQDEDEAVQIAVGYALDRLEPTSRETVPLLVRALKDQHPAVRYWAATLLGRLGEKAKTAVPALTLALQDEDHGPKKGVWNFRALKTPAFIEAREFQTPFLGKAGRD